MKTLDLKHVIEATASRESRRDERLFAPGNVDRKALELFQNYSTGGTNGSAWNTSLALRGITQQTAEAEFRTAEAKQDPESYPELPDFEWIRLLQDAAALYAAENPRDLFAFKEDEIRGSYSLARGLAPFFTILSARLERQCGWNSAVLHSACSSYVKRAKQICSNVFQVSARKHLDRENISDFFLTLPGDDTAWMEWMYTEGIFTMIRDYPMCFKLLCRDMLQYIRNLTVLADRLEADRGRIRNEMLDGRDAGQIEQISFSLSDFHNGGQSVAIIRYDSGAEIVYKPRSTGVDRAWNRFLQMLCSADAGFRLKTLKTLDCGTYGYVEFAQHSDPADIRDYYVQSGRLLCLASLFGATDLHYENIVACGCSPVIVDLETITTPKPLERYARIELDRLETHTIDVSRTLLLAKWSGDSPANAREIGGLTSTYEDGGNSPVIDGVRVSADEYPEELLRGYEEMYRYILTHRDEIRNMIGACGFEQCRYRYVFRNTALYYKLISHFLSAAFLKSDMNYCAVTSRIGAGIVLAFPEETASFLWPMEQSEESAVQRVDIPYFFCNGSSRDICDARGSLISGFFEQSPIEIIWKHLEQMSEDRMHYEMGFIRKNLILSSCQPRNSKSTELVSYRDIRRERQPASAADIEKEIEHIHDILSEYSLDGLNFAYYAPVRNAKTTRYNLNLLENTFYSGIWGVLLFHSAYAVWKHDDALKLQVMDKIDHLMDDYLKTEDESGFLLIGLASGLGGVLRAVVCLSQILKEPSLIEKAVRIALRSGEQYLERSDRTDLFGGTAGYLYAVSQLYLLSGNRELLPIARHASELLKGYAETDAKTGFRVWKSRMEYAPLTGLAHGQAGYALALGLAGQVLEDKELRPLVRSCLAYEERCYSAEDNNWLDLRRFLVARRDQDTSDRYQKRFMYGTCSGTPGIGITRIAMGEYCPEEREPAIIDRSIDFCVNRPLAGCDNYCCGTMGWVDFLVEASMAEHRPELLTRAQEIATSVIPSVSGEKYILSNLKGIYDVSLFTGISGIGYEMIRTLIPEQVPSPLLFHLKAISPDEL